jgi:hypothetical protein
MQVGVWPQVEGLLREERLVAAFEILDLFLELVTQRMAFLERAREVPAEMREAVTSILYMSARAGFELPELETLRVQFGIKYGKEFIAAACTEGTATTAGVNDRIIALMSVAPPPADIKLKRLEEVAKQHGVPFDDEKVKSTVLGIAHDLVATSGQAAWTEEPPLDKEHRPDSTGDAPKVDGYIASPGGEPAAKAAHIASSPVVPLPETAEEYPDAASAARAAAKSAEKATAAAAAAARLAHVGVTQTPEAKAPCREQAAETGDELPSTPGDPPAAVPSPHAPQEEDLDALTRRFEELKRRS